MFEEVIAAQAASDPTWHDARRPQSYTWGSPEGVRAVIDALPGRYPMELIASDMEALIRALVWAMDTRDCGEQPDHIRNQGDCPDSCMDRRAMDLLGTIAETVGVEWI